MKIKRVVREIAYVKFIIEKDGGNDAEVEVTEKHKEAPLASFDERLQALYPVISESLEMDGDWSADAVITGICMSTTQHGTRSVQILFHKSLLSSDKKHQMKTPFFRIDHPADGEAGEREVTKGSAALVASFLDEAQRYIDGERQQVLLPIKDSVEPRGGDETPV